VALLITASGTAITTAQSLMDGDRGDQATAARQAVKLAPARAQLALRAFRATDIR
jgi:hypothetical protein